METNLYLDRITDLNDTRLNSLIQLYLQAFPEGEQRPVQDVLAIIASNESHYFNSIQYQQKSVGFLSFWKLGNFSYLEYFAVFPHIRNAGIGQLVLNYIEKELPGIRLFEVEPVVDELTSRRVKFYERNGYTVFEKNDKTLLEARGNISPLWIMGNKRPDVLEEYILKIKDNVYNPKL